MADHAAKRPRLSGSFSPASPPYHQAAKPRETKPVIHHQPNTPTSPPYSSNPPADGIPARAALPPSEMTPPSSVHHSQPASHSAPPFATPASTAVGPSFHIDSDGDVPMPDRQTNHNRQDSSSSGAGATFGDSSGSGLFKLCQKSHPMSRPHGSQNLFDLYGLNDVAKAMARTDPVTGEKINKLRKSYEGQIKSLQIAGKPKAVKMDGVFTNLLDMPDDFYHAQHEQGKGFDTALSDVDSKTVTPNFDALLDAAFAGIGPGSFSTTDSNRFRAYLGTDDTARPKPQMDGPSARHIPSSSAPTPAASGMASRPSRPERAGAKRNYTDLSFAGYGEGFTDDGYSEAGEGDSQGLSKKRRLGFERTSHPVEVGGARGR